MLSLVAEGLSNKAIAERLFVVERTVEAHVTQIFLKLRLDESASSIAECSRCSPSCAAETKESAASSCPRSGPLVTSGEARGVGQVAAWQPNVSVHRLVLDARLRASDEQEAGVRIFLSYRRDDTSGHAGRLYDALSHRLGRGSVFHDVAAIDPGVDFGDAIVRALQDCDAVLAVIGPAWLHASTPAGVRRLDQPDDYVRLELSTALAADARVIPVLVAGANVPSSTDLPDELRALAGRQAVVLHDQTWQQDVDGLVSRLRGQPPVRRPFRLWAVGLIALAVVAIAVPSVAWLWFRGDDGTNESSIPACPSSERTPLALAVAPVTAAVPRHNEVGPFRFAVEEASYQQTAPDSWLVVLQAVMTNDHGSESYGHRQDRYESLNVDGHPFPVACYKDLNPADGIVGPGERATALVGFEVARDPRGYLQLRLTHEPAPVSLDLGAT